MTLHPGTRLGTYDVLEALGAGGMGEVYRARDPKLERDVAIKIVPDELRVTELSDGIAKEIKWFLEAI